MAQAQDSISVKIPDTAKLTFTKVYNDVKQGISALAQALKVPAEHVYNVLVQQQVVLAIAYLSLILFFFLLVVIFVRASIKCFKRHRIICKEKSIDPGKNSSEPENWGIFFVVLSIIFSLIVISSFCCYFSDIITGFINPEYGALKDIVTFIK